MINIRPRGFRGFTSPYPYIGIGRGGFPRCAWPGWCGYSPLEITPEEELEYLKKEAEFLRKQLKDIEKRIEELENKK